MRGRWMVCAMAATLLISACSGTSGETTDGDPGDARDDSFLAEGKGDSSIPAAGSAQAEGVLELTNEASFETLDDDVSLDVRAARHIVDHRNGPDGRSGTSDDNPYDSLEELDGTPWVGRRAFDKLLSYAVRNDYVEAPDGPVVYGVPEGTDDAEAILLVANRADFETLDDDVSLDRRAAEHIVAYRKGEDGRADTADDRSFESLGDLDGVKWVSRRAFTKLLYWARKHASRYEDDSGTADDELVVEPGTRVAAGVVELANVGTKRGLRTEVGLAESVAKSIVGNADYADLSELRGIEGVDDGVIRSLGRYARNHGYVELPEDASARARHGYEPLSSQAVGILRVANSASETTLVDGAALEGDAAANIVRHRGQSSGEIFTLRELDGISGVSAETFDRLADHALRERQLPDSDRCTRGTAPDHHEFQSRMRTENHRMSFDFAVDGYGGIHAVLEMNPNSGPAYAHRPPAGGWSFTYFDKPTYSRSQTWVHSPSITVEPGADGTVHIAYRDDRTKALRYARRKSDGSFAVETLVAGHSNPEVASAGSHATIAVLDDGTLMAASELEPGCSEECPSEQLWVAKNTGSGWNEQSTPKVPGDLWGVELESGGGTFHMAFHTSRGSDELKTNQLRHRSWSGSWGSVAVLDNGVDAWSIDVGPETGAPHIAFTRDQFIGSGGEGIAYASPDDSGAWDISWKSGTIEESIETKDPDIGVDRLGDLFVAVEGSDGGTYFTGYLMSRIDGTWGARSGLATGYVSRLEVSPSGIVHRVNSSSNSMWLRGYCW